MFCSSRYSAVFFLLFPGIGCRLSPSFISPDVIRHLGGQVDRRTPLFINLTRACVYSLRKRVSARPPGLPSTFYIAVCVDLFHTSFANQPSRVRALPIRLLWKPACCSTMPRRLRGIDFLSICHIIYSFSYFLIYLFFALGSPTGANAVIDLQFRRQNYCFFST